MIILYYNNKCSFRWK